MFETTYAEAVAAVLRDREETKMLTPEPRLSDFPSLAAYRDAREAASPEDRARWAAERDDELRSSLAAAGARTEDCEHGYHWHDSCPACD